MRKIFLHLNNGQLVTCGHKQCWHFARGIIPQLGKNYCIKIIKRFANRTAHTAKRYAQGKKRSFNDSCQVISDWKYYIKMNGSFNCCFTIISKLVS